MIASRVAGLPGPIDGVQPAIDNDELTRGSSLRAADLGFAGRLCLHPRQVAIVHAAFAPSDEDKQWAERVVKVAQSAFGGVVRLDGEMIDKPRIDLARHILGMQLGAAK